MQRSTLLIILCMVAGMIVLTGLGTWQVNRLLWKEELIAKVEARIKQSPISIEAFLDNQMDEEERPYSPVIAEGDFDHSKEVYFYATGKGGAAGWNIHTPLILDSGKALIVNRGFVPYEFKLASNRLEGQVEGRQTITGLVRVPLPEKPNSFVPDNALEKREFYWRDLPKMAELMRSSENREFITFFVDADDAPIPGGFPQGGTTIVSFPNNHLQYALTWYGLAMALLGVGTFFLISRGRNQNE